MFNFIFTLTEVEYIIYALRTMAANDRHRANVYNSIADQIRESVLLQKMGDGNND